MLNRYKDAAKFFNRGILHVERLQMNLRRRENGGGGGKSTGSHSPEGESNFCGKKSEQMLSLLAIGIPMSCGSGSTSSGGVMRSLDDHTRSVLREKYGDKMAKMNNGETDAFADLFAFACPKFIATNEIIKSTGSESTPRIHRLVIIKRRIRNSSRCSWKRYSNERHFKVEKLFEIVHDHFGAKARAFDGSYRRRTEKEPRSDAREEQ